MANEFPQLNETQPIISPATPSSHAESYEAFAKTLGAISNKAEEKTEELLTKQSQSMYINSVANVEQIKTSAQINMLENPENAAKISEQTTDALNNVKQAAFVNKSDRNKLNAYISGAIDDVALKATTTEVHQRQRQAAFTHYANWADQLKAYHDALLSDHTRAEQLKNAMVTSLQNLVTIGSLTPEQAGSGIKTMHSVAELAEDHYKVYGNPNSTAQDYHTVNSNLLTGRSNNTNAPTNASTGWTIDYYNQDKTFQGVLADINSRKLPNPEAFDSLQPAQRKHAIMAIQGTQIADGMINSGESFPAIEAKYNELNAKHRVLSYRDQATKNALGNYIDQLKSGNYLSIMSQTPVGNGIMEDFNSRNAAILKSPIDQDKKLQMILQNKNKMVDEAVAYGQGHHIPSQYIQPISRTDIGAIEESFKLGNDASNVLRILGTYNKPNQAYVANALKNPKQQMVVNAVSLLPSEISSQQALDFIAANQQGRVYFSKNIEDSTNDKTLMSRIQTNLLPAMRMVSENYDREKVPVLQNAMLESTLNYAKYLAYQDHNIGAKDESGFIGTASWKKYVDEASKIYMASYQQQSGTNWIVNPRQLPIQMSNADLDILADHVISEGYKYLKSGRKDYEYESAIGRNPLHMVMSATHDLQAVDGNGKVYFSMPFTTNTLPYAQESKKMREEEKRRLIAEASENLVKRQLNVRLP